MIWVYSAAGLVAFVIVVAIVVAAIQSVRSKDSCHVELDVPEYYGYTGKIVAHVESIDAAGAVVEKWRAMVDRSERGGEPAPAHLPITFGKKP